MVDCIRPLEQNCHCLDFLCNLCINIYDIRYFHYPVCSVNRIFKKIPNERVVHCINTLEAITEREVLYGTSYNCVVSCNVAKDDVNYIKSLQLQRDTKKHRNLEIE